MLRKGLLTQRQSEMVQVDKRISELQQRLARKRQLNQQLSSQMHSNLIRANNGIDENGVHINTSALLRSSVGHSGHRHKSHTMRPLSANLNIAAVEPVLRDQSRISEVCVLSLVYLNLKYFLPFISSLKLMSIPNHSITKHII
jgi:hypothetical protein